MTHSEFNQFLHRIQTLSPEQMRQLRLALDSEIAKAGAQTGLTTAEKEDMELQRRLFEAGLLSEIKPPIRDLMPYQNRKAIPIEGEPLSETVIRERR